MAEEETAQPGAPEEGQETVEQQAQREEAEGQLEGADDSGAEQESQEDGEDAAAKRKERVQKRIDELTKQKYEAQREAQSYKQELEELKKKHGPEAPADDPRPNFDDYDSVEAFQEDVTAWAQRQAQRQPQQEQQSVDPDLQAAIDKVQNAAVDASNRYPDWENVVYDPQVPITDDVIRAASQTDHVADVLYHLGKNPEEAGRIAQLQGQQLALEIGRIESRLEGQQQSQQTTKAPEPINPVKGGSAQREPTADEMPIEEWMRKERERLRGEGKIPR